MVGKQDTVILIDPEEVAELSRRAGTLESMYIAVDVIASYLKCSASSVGSALSWEQLCALAAVYDAGRIQGIREERAKRQERRK